MSRSWKGSPKVSADIFMAIGDLLEPQKSQFSQKIVQKLVNTGGPPPLLSSLRDIKSVIHTTQKNCLLQ